MASNNEEKDPKIVSVEIKKSKGLLGDGYRATAITDKGKAGSGFGYTEKAAAESASRDAKSSGCFLTSACVSAAGLADDCHELEVLRGFRDSYVRALRNGNELIQEYYHVAPVVVKRISVSSHADAEYALMLQEIRRIVTEIESGNSDNAVREYMEMYRRLVKKYSA